MSCWKHGRILVSEVFAALTLTRWIPDRRAAVLHLSGMMVEDNSSLTPTQKSRYTRRHA